MAVAKHLFTKKESERDECMSKIWDWPTFVRFQRRLHSPVVQQQPVHEELQQSKKKQRVETKFLFENKLFHSLKCQFHRELDWQSRLLHRNHQLRQMLRPTFRSLFSNKIKSMFCLSFFRQNMIFIGVVILSIYFSKIKEFYWTNKHPQVNGCIGTVKHRYLSKIPLWPIKWVFFF